MERNNKSVEMFRETFLIMLLFGVIVSPIFFQMNRQRQLLVDNFFVAFQNNEPEKAFKLFEPQYQNWYRENLDVPVPQDWVIQFRPRFFGFIFSNPQWYSGYLLDQEGNVHRFGIEAPRSIFQVSKKNIDYIHISDQWVDKSWSEVQTANRWQRFNDFFMPIFGFYLLLRFGRLVRMRFRKSN